MHRFSSRPSRSTPSAERRLAALRVPFDARVLLIAAVALAGGCASAPEPKLTRTQFSSKERTMTVRETTLPARSASTPARSASTFPQAPRPSTERTPEAPPSTVAADASTSSRGSQAPDDPTRDATASARGLPALPPAEPAADLEGGVPTIASGEADSILAEATRSAWAKLRANAIEMSARSPELLARFAPAGLVDKNRGVRFVTCMAIARNPSKDLGALATPLLDDESESVRAAAILALTRSGIPCDPTPIAAMLESNDPEIRGNAYLVLGELGNRSAAPMIRESIGKGMKLVNPLRVKLVDLAAAEALVKLGDEHEIEPIRAALFAPPEQSELTAVACDAIGRLREEVARPMLERILSADRRQQRSPEIRLSAARALVMLSPPGDGATRRVALRLAEEQLRNPDPRVRALVAALLAETRGPEAVSILAQLVRDADPSVQVAAAGGIEGME